MATIPQNANVAKLAIARFRVPSKSDAISMALSALLGDHLVICPGVSISSGHPVERQARRAATPFPTQRVCFLSQVVLSQSQTARSLARKFQHVTPILPPLRPDRQVRPLEESLWARVR